MWDDPIQAVSDSLPRAFRREEWQRALRGVPQQAGSLGRAGVACTYMWSTNTLFRMIQNVIMLDDEELLARCMPFIRCLNSFILEQNVRTGHCAVCSHPFRLTRAPVFVRSRCCLATRLRTERRG